MKVEHDNYPTPLRLAAAILSEVLDLHWRRYKGGSTFTILEPGCGDVAPFLDVAPPGAWRVGVELREVPCPQRLASGTDWFDGVDYLQRGQLEQRAALGDGPDLVITNPPFSFATQFVERSVDLVHPFGLVAMLLQTGIEGSSRRRDFWRKYPFMKKFNLVPRPGFVGKGTDAREYAAYVWPGPGLASALRNVGRAWSEVATLEWR